MTTDVQTGATIVFRSPTRSHNRKAVRKVTALLPNGDVTVTKYHGWHDFIVHADEIISIIERAEDRP